MTGGNERFGEYLAADEPLKAVVSGRVFGDVAHGAAAIGLTDRRILCLTADDEFVDVRYDYIATTRSRRRTTLSPQGLDYRLLLAAGAVVAVVAFGRGIVPGASWLVTALAVVGLAGVGAIEYAERRSETFDDPQRVMFWAGAVVVVAFVAIVSRTASLTVPFYMALTLCGLAVAEYAYRRREEFDGVELTRQASKELAVDTVDGRTVRIVVDPDVALERDLSRQAYAVDPPAPAVERLDRNGAGTGRPDDRPARDVGSAGSPAEK